MRAIILYYSSTALYYFDSYGQVQFSPFQTTTENLQYFILFAVILFAGQKAIS